MRDILAKTDDDDLAEACFMRLVGRGYDADIVRYLKRRLPLVPERDRESLLKFQMKLGWTRLHAAVDLGIVEIAQREITNKVVVDAQGRDGRTALHVAAEMGNGAIVAARRQRRIPTSRMVRAACRRKSPPITITRRSCASWWRSKVRFPTSSWPPPSARRID